MAVIRYFRWLSLHIAAGAICVLFLVDRLQHLDLTWPTYACLFLAVWSIYLWDHLQDSKISRLHNPRRRFHRQIRRTITVLLIANFAVGACCAFLLPKRVLLSGIAFSLLSALYLFFVARLSKYSAKELTSAIFYAGGVFLAPLTFGALSTNLWMAVQLALLAFANLILFSLYEMEMDEKEGFASIVTHWGFTKARWLFLGTLCALLTSVFLLSTYLPWRYEVFILFGLVTMASLAVRKDFFEVRERYRIVGDLVFIAALALVW